MGAEPQRVRDQALPRRVGRYEAFLQIGAGGMARVYLAVQRGQAGQKAELVVLKILRPEVVEDENVQALFADEARIAMRLQHPNVIRTREVIAEPPDYVLAMDFQNGKSLLDVVSRLGRQAVPLDEHIFVLSKVLEGLSYAHELKDEKGQPFGIVHRDVSPANVLVSYSGEVKLLDFGIAKATGALAATRDGVVKGKLGYAAPEQCLGQPADPRSDIYAVGVMLWEAIAGRRRVSGETWQSVLQARLDDAEPELDEVCPDAPKALRDMVRKALARDPNDRYSTAREFQSDLKKYLSSKGGAPVGPSRIGAMLKPHFDKDRAELHKSVEAFLNSIKSRNAKPGRLPLPGRAAASAPAVEDAPFRTEAKEENTAPIPVDTALLMLSRGETGPVPDVGSRPTAPPPPPAASETPKAPETQPPESAAITAPPPGPTATTTPPPNSTATTTPPPASSTTAPPPPDATVPSAARPSVKPESATPDPAPFTNLDAPAAPAPPKSSPVATDAYGLVTVSKPVTSAYERELGGGIPTKKTPVVALLLIAAAVIALGAVFVVPKLGASKTAAAAPQAPAAETATAAPPPSQAAKIETVKVRISVDPADAIVKLDGKTLTGNPYVGNLPKDTAGHELTIVAEGCKDVKQDVHLNHDVGLLIAMKCLNNSIRGKSRSTAPRAVGASAATAPAAPAHAQPAAEPAPAAPAPEPAAPQPESADSKYGF